MSSTKQNKNKQLIKLGLCLTCRKPVNRSKYYCDKHIEAQRINQKQKKEQRFSGGFCTTCGNIATIFPSRYGNSSNCLCETCYLKQTASAHLGGAKRWLELKNKLEDQNYLCVYTKELLILGVNASVDHILPRSRFPEYIYDVNNIEWVTMSVNEMKRNRTKDEFLALVSLIVKEM